MIGGLIGVLMGGAVGLAILLGFHLTAGWEGLIVGVIFVGAGLFVGTMLAERAS